LKSELKTSYRWWIIMTDTASSLRQALNAVWQATFLFETKEKPKLCVFFIRGFLVIALSRMAEVDDRNSRVARGYFLDGYLRAACPCHE